MVAIGCSLLMFIAVHFLTCLQLNWMTVILTLVICWSEIRDNKGNNYIFFYFKYVEWLNE